jgi:cAMP-dependent protein kinase regulator
VIIGMSILKRDLEVYSESQLDPILRPMVAQVLRKRPKDVVTFMLDYLTKYKADHSHTVPATRSHSPDQKASRFTRRTGFSAEALTMDEVSTHTFRVIPKTSEERQSIRDAVQHNFLFGALDEDQFRVVVDAMERKGYRKNDAIITQGEAGDEFFILEKGRTACYLNQYSPPKCCKKYERGEGFGELALMYSQPRQASIIAEEDCVLWALDRPTFQQVVMRGMAAKRAEYERFLLSLPG